jgi:hypothetical protein
MDNRPKFKAQNYEILEDIMRENLGDLFVRVLNITPKCNQ